MIYWFTGQPHSGKTTLAKYLKKSLDEQLKNQSHNNELNHKSCFHIDGDDLRKIINNNDYSQNGRRQNISSAINIAKYLDSLGHDVIVSLVSPYKDLREELKASNNVIEIYVHTTNIRGREGYHVLDYEPPTENFIEIDTTDVDELISLNYLFEQIHLNKQK